MKSLRFLPLIAFLAVVGCQSADPAGVASSPAVQGEGPAMDGAAFEESAGRSSLSLNRQIIYTADQTVRVANVEKAEKQAEEIVQKAGGFISNQNSDQQDERFPRATLTARVPAKGLGNVLEAFAGLGRQVSRNKAGQDVTDQLVDMEARLRALRAEETAYIEIMKASRKVADVIQVQKELIRVRTEIEQIDAQRVNLKDQVAFSSITLTLTQTAIDQPAGDGNWASESWSGATSSLGVALRNLGSMGIWLLVYLPIWGGCIGLVAWLAVWTNRRAKKAMKPPVK